MHILPDDVCKTQQKVDEIVKYAKDNEMVINSCKSKVLLFNKSVKYDFMPSVKLSGNEILEVYF